jgi:FkbM family methyltransferase
MFSFFKKSKPKIPKEVRSADSKSENLQSGSLTRRDVIYCYQAILGREPESEDVVKHHLKTSNFRDLRKTFLNSQEFMGKFQRASIDHLISADHLKLIESLRCVPAPQIQENVVTDYTGCKISPDHYPSIISQCGKLLQLPIPDDTILHHALEYVGLGLALQLAKSARSETDLFTMAEIGAGNGIWSSRSIICAKAAGYKQVKVKCVEADKAKFNFIKEHFELNGLWDHPDVEVQRFNKPITSDGREVYFPRQESAFDYGVACGDERDSPEYRGMALEMEQRSSISLAELLSGGHVFDFVNIDIQGAELDLVTNSVAVLVEKVRVMVIGTHSRFIEGNLLEVLFANGFELHAEKPCSFRFGGNLTSLCGRTLQDGEQIWVNPKLVCM